MDKATALDVTVVTTVRVASSAQVVVKIPKADFFLAGGATDFSPQCSLVESDGASGSSVSCFKHGEDDTYYQVQYDEQCSGTAAFCETGSTLKVRIDGLKNRQNTLTASVAFFISILDPNEYFLIQDSS